jgi:hypothetical protein
MGYTTHNTALLFGALIVALIIFAIGYGVGCWREGQRWAEEFKWAEPTEHDQLHEYMRLHFEVEDAPDSECYTLPNGECVAPRCKLHGDLFDWRTLDTPEQPA